ncbi:MAG: ArsC/Spx/MgsR family protein [Parachlamydiales bacterium]|jgi:Spx/MgsR family transcriptional regulator
MENKITIYVYSKCSTCQKALRFLDQKLGKSAYIQKEITLTPPNVKDLQKMLQFQNGNLKKLFNTSGQLYREMQLNLKLDSMPLDSALKMLSHNGMLVKRPFLLGKDFGLLGFNESVWGKALMN